MHNIYCVDSGHRLVKLCWNEFPTIALLKETVDEAVADTEFDPGMNFLWDRTPGTGSPASTQFLREALWYLQELAERVGPHSWALVGHNPTDFGKARMLESLSDGTKITIRAFKSAGDAEEWLRNPVRYEPYRATTPDRLLALIEPISA
jgi:hypothetical protein